MWKYTIILALTWKMFLRSGQAFGFPPGISDGPYRAPSSPPDTPEPTNNKPFSASDLVRRWVSWYSELPPSIIISPFSNKGSNWEIKSSTALPAEKYQYYIYILIQWKCLNF